MPPVRRRSRRSLRVLFFFMWGLIALGVPANADTAAPIALHFAPGRYVRTEKLVHLVTFDMSKTLKNMAGGRADDQTILEDRDQVFTVRAANAISLAETNTRHYGGQHPKDSSSKVRAAQYEGTIAPNGTLTPPRDVLEDPGDGALDQLPDIPLAPGQSWTFSRRVKAERELGEGPMTYLDKVERIEDRNGHRIAIISVTGTGQMVPAKDLQDRGFKPATMTLSGTAEFDTTAGLPGVQHYTAKVRWGTVVMFAHIGVILDDTYDASPVEAKPQS